MKNISLKNLFVKILVAFIISLLLIRCDYLKNHYKNKSKIISNNFENTLHNNIKQLVSKTNANDNWIYKISDPDSFRIDDIFSIELEKHWLTDKPILFKGKIINIKSIDTDFYQIVIVREWWDDYGDVNVPRLEIRLKTNKTKIDSFLQQNPNFLNKYIKDVAVIGRINRIDSEYYIDYADTKRVYNIGFGDLLDIISVLNPEDS